ncbi:MAG TPA: type II CAAX endopeptidase family protein [Planctomycetaceae bacterium]|jgi:hypothetical protein|nr:type II CAAX endopeptidase family protein [Planctomycetaceae bacterium]
MMNRVKWVFWNGTERRIRAGWRIVVQLILFILVQIALGILGALLGKTTVSTVAVIALYPVLGAGMIWLVARYIDRRRVADYGFRLNSGWWTNFSFGVVLGAALMTGIFLTERWECWISVTPVSTTESGLAVGPAVLLSLLFYLTVAWMEEFTSRGYQLRNLSEGIVGRWLGPRAAIGVSLVVTSGVFGVLHVLNPNATTVSSLNIMLAGILLALPYVLTGELAISIGLHLGWNFFQGTVYGFPVSGSQPSRRLLILEQSGPDLWTGGAFGPEGGLVGIVATLVGCVLVLGWVQFRYRRLTLDVALARYEPRRTELSPQDILVEASRE